MEVVIRKYRPSDKDLVCTLFSRGTLEHIHPCFYNAITSPLYLGIIVALCAAGYLLGSVFGAVLFPGVWVGLIYYCCHELLSSFVRLTLQTDMQDIPAYYLRRPDDCFWVAEAKIDGRLQIIGTAAVVARQRGKKRQGELTRLNTSALVRRMGLGLRLTQTVIDFCKERGFSELVLETSCSRIASLALYKKLGFICVFLGYDNHAPFWILRLARDPTVKMIKFL